MNTLQHTRPYVRSPGLPNVWVGSEGRIIAWYYCLALAMRPLTKVRPYSRPFSKPQPLQSLAHVMIQLDHFGLHRVSSTFLILLRWESGLKGIE